jgi:hypothetical protein
MTRLALLLMLAASSRVELVDDVYEIPSAEWRYVEVSLKQHPVLVGCDYRVEKDGGPVRIMLLSQANLLKLRRGIPYEMMAATGLGPVGTLRFRMRQPGEYAVVVDNPSARGGPSKVRLRVFLDFSARGGPGVQTLSRGRKLLVILISFAVFFSIVTVSARRLLRGIRD